MIFYKHAPRSNNQTGLESSIFNEDMTMSYSISFSKRTIKDEFYKLVPSGNSSIFEYLRDGHYDFTQYDLDKLLSNITRDLIIKGESFMLLEGNIKEGSLQSWRFHFVPWKAYKKGTDSYFFKLDSSNYASNEKYDKQNILHFSLNDVDLSVAVFRSAMRRILRTSLVARVSPEFSTNKNYNFIQHSKACDLEFLSATKHTHWNGRNYSNQFVTEPYTLYKRGRWLQLRLMILDYLLSTINQFLEQYGKQFDLQGEIQYHSCISSDRITDLWNQYSKGGITICELRDYLFQY